ncbi:MAG: M28 family peptidase [Kangiellaceae bacterium]
MSEPQVVFEEKQKIHASEYLTAKPLILTLILLIVLAIFIRWNLNPTESITESDQRNSFSAISAKQMLADVLQDEKPHPLDSLEIRKTEQRLVGILRSLGYQEEIQETKICEDSGSWRVICTKVRNIIVTIEGTDKPKPSDVPTGILISSHYDSVDAGPGASDAGVAVATMLEISRLMAELPQPKNTIVLLFNEGEEYGLFGAKAFMQQHPLAKELKLAINVEARGSKGSSVMFETGEDSGWLIKEYLEQSPKVLSSSLFYEVYKSLPNDTDLTVFKKHGLQGLNFAHAEKLTHYHTPLDNLANLELATIQHHGDNVWRILRNIKDQDLNSTDLFESNLVYTDILGMFALEWQESTSLIGAISLLLLFLFAIYRISKITDLSKKSLRRGVYSFFILLFILPVLAYLLQLGVISASSSDAPWLVNNFPMQLSLWSLLSLVTILFGFYFLKESHALSVMIGQVCCWIILSIATSYFIVGISFLFIIPSLVSLIILLLFPYVKDLTRKLHLHYVYYVLVIAILFMPGVYTLEIMVTYYMTVAIAIVFAFIMTALMPVLSLAQKANLGMLIKLLSMGFVVGFLWTIFQPSFDLVSKQRLNVYYLQDETKGAYLVAGTKNNKPSKSLQKTVSSLILSEVFSWTGFEFYNQNIDSENLLASKINLIKDRTAQETGLSEFAIDSSEQSEFLREVKLYIPKISSIKSVIFMNNKYELSSLNANSKGYVEFRCIGLSCRSITFSFDKKNEDVDTSQKTIEILIVKVLQGLPSKLQKIQNDRGETAHQSQYGDRSFIVSRIEI